MLVSVSKYVTYEHAIEGMQSKIQNLQWEPSESMQAISDVRDANTCGASSITLCKHNHWHYKTPPMAFTVVRRVAKQGHEKHTAVSTTQRLEHIQCKYML